MSNSKRLLQNVFSNWMGFVVNVGLAFVMSPFVVHQLGLTLYGLWVILNQFTGYLGILELGVRSSVVKYVATHHSERNDAELNQVINGALSMYAVAAAVCTVITAGFALWLPEIVKLGEVSLSTARAVVIISGLTLAQGFVFNVFYGVLMGIQRYDLFNRIGIIAAVGRAVVIYVFLRAGYGLVTLALIQLVTNATMNIAAYIYCRRQVPQLKVAWSFGRSPVYRKIMNYSAATFFVNISQKVIFQTDALVIGAFAGTAMVTFYAIPGTLIEYVRRIVIAMTETFVPLTSHLLARNDHQQIRALLFRGTRMSLLIGLPMGIVLITMGERFIALWVGPEYAAQGRVALIILSVAQVLSFGHLTAREVLNGMAKHRLNAYCYGAEAVANLVLSLAFVGRWGIAGVAAGTAIPHAIITVVVFPVLICRVLEVPLRQFFVRAIVPPYLAGVPLAVVCYWIGRGYPAVSLIEWFTQVLVALFVYAGAVWFLALDPEERGMVRSLGAHFRRRVRANDVTTEAGRRV